MYEITYLRNRLVELKFDHQDFSLLDNEIEKLHYSSSKFKRIVLNAMENCKQDIIKNDYQKAAYELQFIHNMPIFTEEGWNEDYFYKIELLSYIENVNDLARIKKVIKELSSLEWDKQLGL